MYLLDQNVILPGSILAYENQVVHVSIQIGVFWVK